MNRFDEYMKKWIEELRNLDNIQCYDIFKDRCTGGCCVVGLLITKVFGVDNPMISDEFPGKDQNFKRYFNQRGFNMNAIISLYDMNDEQKMTFPQFADYLEANREKFCDTE